MTKLLRAPGARPSWPQFLFLPLLTLASSWALGQPQPDPGSETQRANGKLLYEKHCAQCHGESGQGDGIAAHYVKPKPRDFTLGKYKIRTTPTGALPTHQDLKDIIRNGMPYTTMPAWPNFGDAELSDLAYHLKTFYSRFGDASQLDSPIEIPGAPSASETSIERGGQLYLELGCVQCHGQQGRGDGPAAREQTDDWGFHLRPADMTKPWTFRGGSERQVVYRTFMTGLNGTPMPSYADPAVLKEEDRWPLVDYVFSLSESTDPGYASLVTAVPAQDLIDTAQGRALFESAPRARFPIVGQVIEPGRNFYPSAVDVEVRAVYDDEKISILVEWNDIFAERTGSNDPTLQVPAWEAAKEHESEQIGTPAGAPEADPFGQDPFAAEQTPEESTPGAEAEPAPQFSDAAALQFPQQPPTGNVKPYFIFGDGQNPVELWFADLAGDRPQTFIGRGSVSITPTDDAEPFQFQSSYEAGRWSVIFTRARISRKSFSFQEGVFTPIAFSIWDGYNEERGNKRGLTSWFHLYVEPVDKPSPWGPTIQNGLIILFLQVLIVFAVRRKFAQKAGA